MKGVSSSAALFSSYFPINNNYKNPKIQKTKSNRRSVVVIFQWFCVTLPCSLSEDKLTWEGLAVSETTSQVTPVLFNKNNFNFRIVFENKWWNTVFSLVIDFQVLSWRRVICAKKMFLLRDFYSYCRTWTYPNVLVSVQAEIFGNYFPREL